MAKSNKRNESLKRKHWSIKSHESLISRNAEGHFCLNVEGGAENGLFSYVGEIRQDRIHYQNGKLYHGELILEVNGKRVPGMIKKDVIALIKRSADPVSLRTVKQNATITKDIRQYLSTRFTKDSVDSELQHQIRENLHMRVVPCTTRSPQEGERHGVDYNFISVDEFKRMEKSGELLESGQYQSNYYGTPKPPGDPSSSANFPAYSRSSANSGYSKEGVLPSNSMSPPPFSASVGRGPGGFPRMTSSKNLGPLPKNWEIAYTENNEKYFIDHNSGCTHWLDPRLTMYMKRDLLECSENELPYGWEKVNDPVYGTYYIDHTNRVTQYENPVVEAKRRFAGSQLPNRQNEPPPLREPPPSFQSAAAIEKQREAEAAAMWPDAGLRDYPDSYPYPYQQPPTEQDLEADLQGEVIHIVLSKTPQGFGFTIIGGDRPGELLQIKSIVRGSVSDRDGRLRIGDVLVRINGISVLTYNHRKVVDLFQSINLGTDVQIEVRRGYPLPDFPPGEQLPSYSESNQGYMRGEPPPPGPGAMPEKVVVSIIKGPLGFGFSLGESHMGPVVKMIMDHPRCAQLQEGDVLMEVNGENVRSYVHNELVTVLKRCPKGNQAAFVVLRQPNEEHLPSYSGPDGYNDGMLAMNGGGGGEEPFQILEIRLMRQVSGFGFRIIGGREEGSQATIGAIVSGGAADLDGRLIVGDEITHINGRSVLDASHRDVITLMGEAAAQGEVVLRIQRKMPSPESMPPPSSTGGGVPQHQQFHQGMGGAGSGGEDERFPEIPKGIRDVVVNRPNEQTSFGFVLQSNTLRPGCMICRLIPDSPADQSGLLYMYDELLAVNNHDVSRMDHADIVGLIKSSGINIQLTVQQPEDIELIVRQQMMEEQQQQFGGMSPEHQNVAHGGLMDTGSAPMNESRGEFQDYPGMEEEQPPLISGNLSDIASDDEEIHHIEVQRSGGGFGFSIRGGAEYNSPLCVLRIADGGAAERDGRLRVGDELLEINGNSTEGMLHSDAITIIKHGGDVVKLIIRRMSEEAFLGSGNYKSLQGPDGAVFSPTAVQTKDRYTQDYMNSLNRNQERSRSGSGDPRTPPPH